MGTTNTYVPGAYNYFSQPRNVTAIANAAAILGISKTAVAAFIVKENNNYETIDLPPTSVPI